MTQAVIFGCGQCRGDLLRNLNGCADIERTRATNALLQRLALDQFHRVKKLPRLFANSELEHRGNVLVSQRGRCASFTYETLAGLSALRRDSNRDNLQRHLAMERRI